MRKLMIIPFVGILLIPTISAAIFGIGDTAVVIDPTNLIQNSATAGRMLQSIQQQATQIQQDINFYTQQAKHLISLPMSYVDDITRLYQQYNNLLQQGRGIAWTTKDAISQWEKLYEVGFNGNVPIMQRAQAMIGQIRAVGASMNAVSALYDQLCADQAQAQALVAASQAAPGTLAAQQATNQMLYLVSQQQGSLQQLTAATGRLQSAFIMREVTAEERAAWNAQQFIQGYGEGIFRGPHEGQGKPLPQ